jgi:hypothetical protein
MGRVVKRLRLEIQKFIVSLKIRLEEREFLQDKDIFKLENGWQIQDNE